MNRKYNGIPRLAMAIHKACFQVSGQVSEREP
jgi:hypothetical protein